MIFVYDVFLECNTQNTIKLTAIVRNITDGEVFVKLDNVDKYVQLYNIPTRL